MTGPAISARHPLREAPFARLWISGLLSETGKWVLQLALPLYVLQLTRSALVTSFVAMLGLLPSLVASPVVGALVDRWDQRRFLVLVSVAQAALLPLLLLVKDPDDLWLVYLVTGTGATLTVAFEAVKNVTLSTIVVEEQLVSANAAIGLNVALGRLVGSPLGGLLLSTAGLPYVLAFGSAAFLVAAALASTIPPGTAVRRQSGVGTRFWTGIGEGLRTLRDVPTLRGTFVCVALLAVAQGMFVVLFLLFVTDLINGGDTQAGLLRGVQAVGGFAGTATAGLLTRRLGAPRLLSLGVLVFGAVSALTWNLSVTSVSLGVYVGLFTAAGVPAVWLAAAWLSLIQESSPLPVRGRVMACVLGLSDGLQAVGMLAAGLLSGVIGVLPALNVQAALIMVAGFLALKLLPGGGRAVIADAGPTGAVADDGRATRAATDRAETGDGGIGAVTRLHAVTNGAEHAGREPDGPDRGS
ncbi:MFS transporter [Streptomyces griseoluteus]|uniref:MFS transporter n=1 Tax=Streptomyces griseoluteus TaxID=29306 RepID=UPI0034073298